MGKVQLIIDNQIADVYNYDDVLTSVTYSISDINDIDVRGNSTSKTIKIPATPTNRKIFGFADDVSVTSMKGQRVSLIGSVRIDGTEILTGLVNLKSFQQAGNDRYFELTIIGNSGQWIETMTGASLRMHPDDGIYDGYHYMTAANIAASLAGDLAYAYPLINNGFQGGNVEISNIEDDGQGKCVCYINGTNELYNFRKNIVSGKYVVGYGFGNSYYNKKHYVTAEYFDRIVLSTPFMGDSSGKLRSTEVNVVVENRPLAIRLYNLMNRLFSMSGYKLSSAFFETAFFKSLFMLPGCEKQSQEWIDSYTVSAGLSAETYVSSVQNGYRVPLNTVISGNSSMFTASANKITATRSMHVVVNVKLNAKGTEGYPMKIYVYVNGTNSALNMTNRATGENTLSESGFVQYEQEAELRLSINDYVQVFVNIPEINYQTAWLRISQYETIVTFTPQDTIVKNTVIYPYEYLPDIKQIEFVKAIRHLFNLYFYTDVNNKIVYVEPRDTFYRRDKNIDLSEKLDKSKQITLEELGAETSKTLVFKYKEDGADEGIIEYNSANDEAWSVAKVILGNMFSSKDEKVIENTLFAPTLQGTFDSIGLTVSVLPKIWGKKEGDIYPERLKEYEPRILYFAGMRDCSAGESWTFEGTTQSEVPLFCVSDGGSVNNNSLMFNPQPLVSDLYSKHYENYVRTLNNGRKLTAYFNLTAQDVQALTISDKTGTIVKDFRSLFYVRIGSSVMPFRLESVNDFVAGKNQSTKVVMITDVDNISQQVAPFINSMQFVNDTSAIGTAYANCSVSRFGSIWSEVRSSGTGSVVTQGTVYGAGGTKGSTYRIERMFLFFDTSNLPEGATITEAYIDLYKVAGDYSQEVALFAGYQSGIVTLDDYDAYGTTLFGQSVAGTLGVRRIILNAAGKSHLNKTGWTKFCVREYNYDGLNNIPALNYTTFKTYQYGSPSQYRNKLTVKYTL